MNNDTIAAICTPPGNSANGIIRISGSGAFSVINKIFTSDDVASLKNKKRSCLIGKMSLAFKLEGRELTMLSPAMVYFMPAPASYTCEDVAEIILPGSQALLSAALKMVCSHGARIAGAGEFTLRAFLNGRIDLTQAEAVERIIDAETEAGRREAIKRVGGQSARQLAEWRRRLLEISGTVEAALDFAEEDIDEDIEFDLAEKLALLASECSELTEKCARHQPEENGIRVTFAGLTNAGKSSLLNALLGEEKVLVSAERSTTRDRISFPLEIERFQFSLEDCPGIDSAVNTIAAAASEHARNQYAASPLLLLVLDSAQAVNAELNDFIRRLPVCRVILVYNKSDLSGGKYNNALRDALSSNASLVITSEVSVSALTGDGVEQLRRLLFDEAMGDMSIGGGLLTRREAMEIDAAAGHCLAACSLIGEGLELAAVELRLAYEAFSRAGGEGYAEDILENVFSRFCIGK